MTISFKRIAAGLFQMLVGLTILAYCGDGLHDELLRTNRSALVLIGFGIGVVIGALIVPGASPIIQQGSTKAWALIRDGRRATDGLKLTEIEIPPSVKP